MRKVILTGVCLAAAGLGGARADSVTLTSGEKLEGTIKSDTDAGVTMEVRVTAGITDERTIPRAEIAKVEKAAPDELAYAEIKGIRTDPQTSFPAETYEHYIFALKGFQTKYPASPHFADVQHTLDDLQREKERVAAGEVKFLGRWLSKEEAEKRGVQIQAAAQFAAMKEQAARNDVMGALLTFDALEKTRSNTRAYPDAVDLARQLLPRLQAMLAAGVKAFNFQQTEFQKELALQAEPQKSDLLNAYKREQAQFDAALATAAKNGSKWPPFLPRSAKSLTAVGQTAATEITRLSTIPTQKMRESIARVDQARAALDSRDLARAEPLLKEAATLWPQNEAAEYWGAQLKAQQQAAAAAAAVTPSPSPSPISTPSPAPAPGSASAEQPATMPAASADAPPAGAAEPSARQPFFRTVPGALTIVGVAAVILGGVSWMAKAKAARGADQP